MQKIAQCITLCLAFGSAFHAEVSIAQGPITVVDFRSPEVRRRWRIVNDGVMGGLSQSRMAVTEGGTGVFQGTVSLENNGGFASVRTQPTDFGLAGRKGLSLRIKGDGRRYQLRLRTDRQFDGVAYTSSFDTVDGEWTTARVEFQDCLPTFRGRKVSNAPTLEPSRIRQIGFLIADKQQGPFRLEIESIKAY
jgi:monofunctional biosynthetic peptidoglycan transglycosylase